MKTRLYLILALLCVLASSQLVQRDEPPHVVLGDGSKSGDASPSRSSEHKETPTHKGDASSESTPPEPTHAHDSGPKSSPSPSPSPSSDKPPPAPPVDVPEGQVTKSQFDVSAAPSSIPRSAASASSNVTDHKPAVTKVWDRALPSIANHNYRGSQISAEQLPEFYFNVANASLSETELETMCDQQRRFCQIAGCEDDNDEVYHNWCDPKTGMAVMCTCRHSKSRLAQFEWPVQMNDCLMRVQECHDKCNNGRKTPFMQRSQCTQACADHIGSSCGKPVQYGANYAVINPGDRPNYKIVDQSEPRSAATCMRPSMYVVVAALVAASLAK